MTVSGQGVYPCMGPGGYLSPDDQGRLKAQGRRQNILYASTMRA